MISFVIPAYNEEKLLGGTLSALHAAARAIDEPCEIIVADDGSTDRTKDIASSAGARVVSVSHRHIAATRNSGAREAKGGYLCFVDADTEVNANVLRAMLAHFRNGGIGGGASVRFDEPTPRYVRLGMPLLMWIFRACKLSAGCFLFCTREGFEAVGGFNERQFGAEELTISRALKRRGRFRILKESVTTSGRKVRAYSLFELLGISARILMRGRNAVRDRKGLEIWYGERRPDPKQES